jgi:phage shock protein A
MIDDKEFLSLDLEGAKEYLIAWATTVKRYEQDIAAVDQDLATWKGRVDLASSQGRADLAEAAEGRCRELAEKRAGLEAERAGLAGDVVRLRERLPYLKARERSIDPDLLLAELQSMTGELLDPEAAQKAKVEGEFAKLEEGSKIDDALAELKRKIGGQAQ